MREEYAERMFPTRPFEGVVMTDMKSTLGTILISDLFPSLRMCRSSLAPDSLRGQENT